MVLKEYLKLVPEGVLLSLGMEKGTEWVAIGYPRCLDFTSIDRELKRKRAVYIEKTKINIAKKEAMLKELEDRKKVQKSIRYEEIIEKIYKERNRRIYGEEDLKKYIERNLPERLLSSIENHRKKIKEMQGDPLIKISVLDRKVVDIYKYFYPIDGKRYIGVKIEGMEEGTYWDYGDVVKDGYRFIKRKKYRSA